MKELVLDIETNRAQDTIWCCICQDVQTEKLYTFTVPDGLSELLKQYDKIIGHNIIGFDAPKLSELWGVRIPVRKALDTLILSRLLNPVRDGGHSLRSWGIELGNDKLDFDDYDGGLTDEMLEYCQRDVEVTTGLYRLLQHRFKEWNKPEKSIDLEHQVAVICAKQERNGFKLDVPEAQILYATLVDRMAIIETEMQEVFPPIVEERWSEKTGKQLKDKVTEFNPGSRLQIGDRLQELGWKPKQFTETGKAKVDETILESIDLPQAQLIAEYLMIQKRVGLIDSWLKYVDEKTERVHGGIITLGTITGRMAHRSPNLGQVPSVAKPYGKECRSLFTVEDGNVLCGSDLSGVELRCLSHYMQDPEWQEELLNGDIHTRNAEAAGIDRSTAKTMVYALLYGCGITKLGTILGVGTKEAENTLDNFYSNTPKLRPLITKVQGYAKEGWVPGLDNRRVQVRSEHAALNTLLQSCGAIIAKQWNIEMHKTFRQRKLEVRQVAFVHDEIQIEAAESDAEEVASIMEESAVKAGIALGFRCPIAAESKVGRNWYETH